MKATPQYREMAKNQEAVRYTVSLIDFMMRWWQRKAFTYSDVEEYYFNVYRNIDPRFSVRTVERKIRELAEKGYLIRERWGRTYLFHPTPAFYSLVAQLEPTGNAKAEVGA